MIQSVYKQIKLDVAIDVGRRRIRFGWVLRYRFGSFKAPKYVVWNGVSTSKERRPLQYVKL